MPLLPIILLFLALIAGMFILRSLARLMFVLFLGAIILAAGMHYFEIQLF